MNSLRSSVFVETLEHRRFTEFCDACACYCYIGLCYGAPGVGKTLSAGRYSRWDIVKQIDPWREVRGVSMEALTGLNTIFYTPPIINTPRQIEDDIQRLRDRLKRLAFEPLRQEEDQQLRRINQRDKENNYVTRTLIFPDSEEYRLPEAIIPRPLREFDLADHFRLHQWQRFISAAVNPWSHRLRP